MDKRPLAVYGTGKKEMKRGDEIPYDLMSTEMARQIQANNDLIKCLAKQLNDYGLLTDPDLILLIQS